MFQRDDGTWALTVAELDTADRADKAEREAFQRAERCAAVCGLDWNVDSEREV